MENEKMEFDLPLFGCIKVNRAADSAVSYFGFSFSCPSCGEKFEKS